jgi:predicted nucleotidyltransferase
MSSLQKLLSSRVRAEIFRLLFGVQDRELHARELGRQSGLNEASIRQEMVKLKELDLVVDRRDGNRIYYKANRDHPIYPEIHNLVLKTTGLIDVLRKAIEKDDISTAFVFGSVATGQESANSDIDLMVVSPISLRSLSARLSDVAAMVGRETNPHVMTAAEFHKRRQAKDHFVTHVLRGPKLFIRGNKSDFEAMAK